MNQIPLVLLNCVGSKQQAVCSEMLLSCGRAEVWELKTSWTIPSEAVLTMQDLLPILKWFPSIFKTQMKPLA